MLRLFSFIIVGIPIIALSAMAAACAGDAELSSAEYFERAETTFDGTTGRLRRLSTDYQEKTAGGRVDSAEEEIELIRERDEKFIALLTDVGRELDKMGPPAEVSEAHDGYATALEDLIEAYEELHSSDAYEEYLVTVAEAGLREQLERAETPEEINAIQDELRAQLPADPGIQPARERLKAACGELNEAAPSGKTGVRLSCDL